MSERVLLLRFHSLGDVILATALLPELAKRAGRSVDVLTERKFTSVFEGSPWIERIWHREDIVSEAAVDDLGKFDRVVDLQGTASARALVRKMGPRKTVRTRGLARRWVAWTGRRGWQPAIPHCVERYAEAAELGSRLTEANALPEVFVTVENRRSFEAEFADLATRSPSAQPRVALLTGASRKSKEYPRESFLAVGRELEAAGCSIIWVEGPAQELGDVVGQRVRTDLGTLKAALATVDLVITSDSGPMHLATALQLPTLAIFGSSVRPLGFWPLGANAKVLEAEGLHCRPCGVHGRNYCRRGDWACLERVTTGQVTKEALSILAKK